MAEITENEFIGSDELIVIKQLPIIEEQLHQIKAKLEEEVEYALSLECTEDTLQDVKKSRTYLNNVYKYLEDKRKRAKADILTPYEAFEKVYKECVTNVYTPCNEKLTQKIQDVENALKQEKESAVTEYFNEYKKALGIDFVSFSQSGIKASMTISKKKLHEQAKEFLDKVVEEIELINTQEFKDEILVEYKSSLNVASAITTVSNRHKAIEAEQQKRKSAEADKQQQAEAVRKVESVIEETITPPQSYPEEEQKDDSAKTYEVHFKVRGELQKLKELKEFLVKGGFDYEQF